LTCSEWINYGEGSIKWKTAQTLKRIGIR